MGPIVYHTHFAVFIETILPIALFLALSEARESYTFLGVAAVLLTAVVVSASRGGLIIALRRFLASCFCRISRSPRLAGESALLALILAGVTAVLMLIVGFETASERFSFRGLDRGTASVRHLHATHDSRASLDRMGAGKLACGVSRLRHVRSWSHRQSGPLLTGCSGLRKGACRSGLPCSLSLFGHQAGDSVDLGNRRDRCPDPCGVRLPIFAPGRWGMAYSDSFYGAVSQQTKNHESGDAES